MCAQITRWTILSISTVVLLNAQSPGAGAIGVGMTAPANGSTLSGNATLSARVVSSLSVGGVQFMADGSPIGAEVTAAPYIMSWDTTSVANGTHSLSAVARDSGGNRAAATVSVSINNAAAPAPAPPPPPAPVVSISVGPSSVSLAASQTQQFTATVTGSNNAGVSWSINGPGSISNGLYTAPSSIASSQNVTVMATSLADGTKTATAVVALSAPAPVVSITLGPASVSLSASQTQQFTATVTGSSNASVSWSLNGPGTISNGLYTAPATIANAQNVTVTATSVADGSKIATAVVALTVPAPAVSITLAPGSVSLSASQTQQFMATVLGTNNPSVFWSISGAGTISNGVYTAPAAITSAQQVTVKATSVADGTKTASATIALTPAAPAVSITLGPTNASLGASKTQQFTASVTGSGNSGVSWSLNPPLGTISNGFYTAPSTITSAQNVMLTATSLADATKTAVAMIALTLNTPPVVITAPGSNPFGVSIIAPVNGTKVSGNVSVSASALSNAGIAGVQFSVDGVAIGGPTTAAPYTVNWNSLSVADGTHTLTAVAQDMANNHSAATILINVSNGAAVSSVTLPVEVIGADGFTKAAQVNVGPVPNGAVRLWLQIHGLRYQAQASVQVNGSGWLPVNDGNVTLLGQAGAYGGIGGGFHTLTMTMNLPAGAVNAGNNTVSFRFNGTDGNVSGFRVLAFNFIGSDGSMLVPATAFVNEDPNTWQPPSTQASDIAAGKGLWYGAALTVPTAGGPAAIRANCTSCHAQDGRDLKYFNYSNNSIRTRALFHGLTAQQGDQIASYIRSLSTPNPGRVWNPPYQPGPGLDSLPVEQWSAGAGLGSVLNTDQDLLHELFPNGMQESVFAATGNLNVRETAIPLQLPDWNSWLPTIHPLDAWGDEFTNSKYFQDYVAIRGLLHYGDPVAYTNANPTFQVWPGNYVEFLGPKVPNPGPNPDPNYWTPRFINQAYSTALWNMVKNWELNQEFGLEAMAKVIFTNPQADSRAWNSEFAFFTSPNMLHIPRGFPGLDNAKLPTFVYLSFIWYHTQLILNNSNHQQSGTSPIDWPYSYGFIYEMATNASPGQTGLLYLWMIKGRQVSNNGLGPDVPGGWAWTNNDPSTQIIQDPEGLSLWAGTSPSTQSALYEGNVRAFLDVVEKFTPQQFYNGGAADPTVAPVHGNLFGSFEDRMWYTIPLLRYFGVSQPLINELAGWAQSVWPVANWSLTTTDTCAPGNSGITCSTYH